MVSYLVAVGVGLLIGMQRQRGVEPGQEVILGARTFPLIALIGAMVADIGAGSVWLPAAGLLVVGALLLVSYYLTNIDRKDLGITTEMVAVVTFFLGMLAGSELYIRAAGIAVIVLILLESKTALTRLTRALTPAEINAVLQFGALALILLPALPDQGFGPYAALNPFEITWMVVLIAAIGLVGFVAVRVLGPGKGIGATGIVGGLISSTAVTLSLSRLSERYPTQALLGILGAWAVMAVRVAAVAYLIAPAVGTVLVQLMVVLALFAAALVWFGLHWGNREEVEDDGAQSPTNPFSMIEGLKFGLLFAAVTLAAAFLKAHYGEEGLLLLAAVSGLTDVDPINLALARMAVAGTLDPNRAAELIVVAVMANTVVKAGMAITIGRGPFRVWITLASLGMLGGMGLFLSVG